MKNSKLIILMLAVFSIIFVSCGDDIPTDYKPENFVEAVLLVGEPIRNISVIRTQPIYHPYDYYKSFIKDAQVIIRGDGREFPLRFNFDTLNPGYFFDDEEYLVKANIEYSLEVTLSDGKILTGKTTTPGMNEWVKRPSKFIQYPIDSTSLPAGDSISWQRIAGYDYYLIAIVCLDTLEYGKYLDPATNEMNRRIYKPFASERQYKDVSQTAFVPNTKTPIVWSTFKWFGMHEVIVYTPDWNFARWFIQNVGQGSVNPLLGSIEGGIGVFGSASAIRDTAFLKKNQP